MGLRILYCSDEGYAPHLATSMHSLLRHNSEVIDEVYVFTSDMTSQSSSAVISIGEAAGVKVFFVFLDDSCFDNVVLGHHFQKANYYRLFAADFVPGDKCLYIDSDTIIVSGVGDLQMLELCEEMLVAAVEEFGGFERHEDLRMTPGARYFNSGVMMLNLHSWRLFNVKERVIEFVKAFPESIKFVDQCGLNAIVNGQWLCLDERYNFQTASIASKTQLLLNPPAIVHFTGSTKPWHLRSFHPFKAQYWKLRNQTMFKRSLADDFSIVNSCSSWY